MCMIAELLFTASMACPLLPPLLLRCAAAPLQNEPQLLQMLDEVRWGSFSPEARALLATLARPLPDDDGIQATDIFPTNAEASG